MQKVIGLVGYVNKTDFVINLAKTFMICNKNILVVDGTIESRLKYTIPALETKEKAYVTQYDGIDFAVGFKNMHEVENYTCKNGINIGLYDYILIDIDNGDSYDGMRARGYDKIYFFVEHTNISIARNTELLKTLLIFKPLDKNLALTKVLFRYYITRASETYYENKLNNFPIDWSEGSYDLQYDDMDRIADIESQQSSIIQVNKHTKRFVSVIADMVAEMEEGLTSGEVRKKVKEYIRRGV